jgi:hypothetical protein
LILSNRRNALHDLRRAPQNVVGLVAKARIAARSLSRDSHEQLTEPNEPFASLVLDNLAGVPA